MDLRAELNVYSLWNAVSGTSERISSQPQSLALLLPSGVTASVPAGASVAGASVAGAAAAACANSDALEGKAGPGAARAFPSSALSCKLVSAFTKPSSAHSVLLPS